MKHLGDLALNMCCLRYASILCCCSCSSNQHIPHTDFTAAIALAVVTCKAFNEEQIIKNIEKNLKWADQVFFVAPNVRDKEKIQNLAKEHGFEKVEVLTYSDLDNVNTLFRLTSYSKYMREKPEAIDG